MNAWGPNAISVLGGYSRNLVLLASLTVFPARIATAQLDKSQRPSPPASAECILSRGRVVHVDYSSPRLKGRKIFGTLVPYGQVWRAGANEATSFVTDADLTVGGTSVPAGKYTLFTIPNQDKWTLIISKKIGEWGTDYPGPQEDQARIDMKTSNLPSPAENFTIAFDNLSTKGCTLRIEWENTRAWTDVAEQGGESQVLHDKVLHQTPFELGLSAAREQDYMTAMRYFEEARKATPESPEVLFNLALAESKIPSRELRAIVWFEAYLGVSAIAANAPQVRREMENLKTRARTTMVRLASLAKESAMQFSGSNDRDRVLLEAAEAQAVAGDIDGAKETAGIPGMQGVQGDGALHDITGVLAWSGDIDGARKTAASISRSEWAKSDAYVSIARAQAIRWGDIPGARSTLAIVSDWSAQSLGLIGIAEGQFKVGRKEESYETLRGATRLIAASNGTSGEKDESYARVGIGQADLCDFQGAEHTAELISAVGQANVVHNRIKYVKGFLRNGEYRPFCQTRSESRNCRKGESDAVACWTKFLEKNLSEPLYTDVPAFLRALSQENTAKDMISKLYTSVSDLSQKLKEIEKMTSGD